MLLSLWSLGVLLAQKGCQVSLCTFSGHTCGPCQTSLMEILPTELHSNHITFTTITTAILLFSLPILLQCCSTTGLTLMNLTEVLLDTAPQLAS